MAERFRPYRMMLAAQVRAQTSYRVSFAVELVGAMVFTALDLLTVLVLFRVTRSLGGFGFHEAFLMTAVASLSFATADLVAGNIDALRVDIRNGHLDALLTRPLGVLRQLFVTDFALRRVGRVVQGLAVLAVAWQLARVGWSVEAVGFLVVTVVSGAAFFCGLFVTGATVQFWWIDSGEFANGFTYGGRDFTAYPVTVYGTFFRRLFAFGLGFAFVAYYPSLVLLRRPDPLGLPGWTGWLTPVVAAVVITVATTAWRFGLRHYRSTGS